MSCHFCHLLAHLHELPGDSLVGQFSHSIAILAPWQFYTGYCVLVSRVHATELFELSDEDRRGFLDEMTRMAQVLHCEFRPRKLNYELLGNQVPHLHWHLIPRYQSDPDQLKPAWIAIDRAESEPELKKQLMGNVDRTSIGSRIRNALLR